MTQADISKCTELEEQLRFERLLSDILADFVALSSDQVDGAIQSALQKIVEAIGIDRSTLFQFTSGQDMNAILTHSWCLPGLQSHVLGISGGQYWPWFYKKILGGEIIRFTSIDELPLEAVVDRESLINTGQKSNISIPLVSGGELLGVLAFGTVIAEREWPDMLVDRLKLIAQVFANALARKRTDQALRESEERLDLAASSAGAGLWILDLGTGNFWATDKARELFGYAKDEEINFETLLHTIHPDDREHVRGAVEQSIRGKANFNVEYRIALRDERVCWIISRGRPYFSASGDPERVMGVSMDITERKNTEESLHKAYDEIRQLKNQLEAENIYLRKEVSRGFEFEHIIGRSAAIMEVLRQTEQVAATDATVLLSGETGTGKELIAQAIHSRSKRHGRFMVKVNCASLPDALIESELFGREKGAYTGALARQIGRFELADQGTLFLDEITELPLELQAKLLRVLQNGEFERLGSPKTIRVNVRLIAATNRDMAEAVRSGRFREDLYYRLNVFPIKMPPLRERMEDIPLMVQAFITEFCEKMGKKIQAVPKKTIEALQLYSWPGNVRELRNVIERGVIVSSGSSLQVLLPQAPAGASFQNKTMEETEYQHIMDVLSRTGWRIKGTNGAATLLGLKPSTLYSRMNKLGIPNRREKVDIST
jgi:formate hydrogenlyase transcriptional activator